MSFLKRLFSKKTPEDFETVLATLASDIQKRQVKLSEIRLRQKRSTLLATLYTLLIWVSYTSLWYWNILPSFFAEHGKPGSAKPSPLEKFVRGFPVLVGPIVILFIRRIVQIWYTRKADAEEKTLQKLMKQRRTKVDEIKKKTNFDSMVKLFQEYDEPSPGGTPMRRRIPQGAPVTPHRQTQTAIPPNGPPQTPVPPALQAYLTSVPSPMPMAPPRKQWYDKLADALLGDDERDVGSPSSRYALICERCFTHNGLVKESMWEDAQFVCRNPKCNHFNRSTRAKREAPSTNVSPRSVPFTPQQLNDNRFSITPSPQPSSPATVPGDGDSDVDAPTVDNQDASMEVDS